MPARRSWRTSANITFLFAEHPFLDRFAAAAAAGFDAVEFVCLFDHSPGVLAERAREANVETSLINIPHGDWAAGERGIACLPDRRDEFAKSLERTIAYCEALGCRRVNCLAGLAPAGADPSALRETLVANLALAHATLSGAGIGLQMEPINTRDMPGFFVSTADQAVAILADAGLNGPALQFDAYHEQVMTGDAIGALERLAGHVAHVQIADAPGRNEPGTGTLDFAALFSTLDRLGYSGRVGLEYKPATTTREGLGWMARYGLA